MYVYLTSIIYIYIYIHIYTQHMSSRVFTDTYIQLRCVCLQVCLQCTYVLLNSLHILSFSNLPWYATYARGTAKANIARATWCIPRRSTLYLTAPRPHTFSRKIAQVRKPGDLFPKRCKAETSSSPVDVPQIPVEPWQANPFKSFAVLFHRSPTHLVAQKKWNASAVASSDDHQTNQGTSLNKQSNYDFELLSFDNMYIFILHSRALRSASFLAESLATSSSSRPTWKWPGSDFLYFGLRAEFSGSGARV